MLLVIAQACVIVNEAALRKPTLEACQQWRNAQSANLMQKNCSAESLMGTSHS
jgi:hypothetical protein